MAEFKGISYPFRFNSSGGVSTSVTNSDTFDHIKEGVEQILLTLVGERAFKPEYGSKLKSSLFDMRESSNRVLLAEYVREALEPIKSVAEVVDVIVKDDTSTEGDVVIIVDVVIFVKKFLKSDVVSVDLTQGGILNG